MIILSTLPKTGNPTPNCQSRLATDLDDFEIANPNCIRLEFPDPKDLQKFYVYIKVFEGLYRDKWFKFLYIIPDNWPNDEPYVRILNKIWHPNIELLEDGKPETGRICISTLGRNYQACYTLWDHVITTQCILVKSYPNDSRNPAAGTELKSYPDKFRQRIIDYLDEMEDPDFEKNKKKFFFYIP